MNSAILMTFIKLFLSPPALRDVKKRWLIRCKKRYKKSWSVMFFVYSDHHTLVGYITRFQVPNKQLMKEIYRTLEHFDGNVSKNDINMITFDINNSDVGDQYWIEILLNILKLNLEPFRKIAPYMNSKLQKHM